MKANTHNFEGMLCTFKRLEYDTSNIADVMTMIKDMQKVQCIIIRA